MQGTRLHLSNTSVCSKNMASINCGASEGTEYVQNHVLSKQVILVYLNNSTRSCIFFIVPAVNVFAYTGPVENTLPLLNPDWLTVKV